MVSFGDLVRRFAFGFAIFASAFLLVSGATAVGQISFAMVRRDFRDLAALIA
jgi:hypothetical protein